MCGGGDFSIGFFGDWDAWGGWAFFFGGSAFLGVLGVGGIRVWKGSRFKLVNVFFVSLGVKFVIVRLVVGFTETDGVEVGGEFRGFGISFGW